MADEKNETLPGFMARLSAAVTSILDKVTALGDQSKRIAQLETDLDAAQSSLSISSKALAQAESELATAKAEHATTKTHLADTEAKRVDAQAALDDPKGTIAKGVAAGMENLASKMGIKPVKGEDSGDSNQTASSGKEHYTHWLELNKKSAREASQYWAEHEQEIRAFTGLNKLRAQHQNG